MRSAYARARASADSFSQCLHDCNAISPTAFEELSAIVGAAYEAFVRARLERRAGRRGKVHAQALVVFADMVSEMLTEAGPDGEEVWRAAVAELERDRSEIEAEFLGHHGLVVVGHEWAAFVEWMGQVRRS